MNPAYRYRATVDRWVDADTVDLLVDLGFRVFVHLRVRLARVDAPERAEPAHVAALEHVSGLAPAGASVLLSSQHGDRYGRWVGEIETAAGANLSSELLRLGLAQVYA